MTESDLTVKVLVEMRDELRNVRDETRQTNRQLGELRGEIIELRTEVRGTNERLDVTNQRLDLIEHTMVDYGTQLVMLGRYMKNSTSRNENDIADLRTRVEKLEAKD